MMTRINSLETSLKYIALSAHGECKLAFWSAEDPDPSQ